MPAKAGIQAALQVVMDAS